jgi:spermidine synthase
MVHWGNTLGDRFHISQGLVPDVHIRPLVFDIGDSRSLYFNFDGLQSSMKRGEPSVLEVDYTKTMMGFLLFNPTPAKILMIGLGGGSLPKFCYHNLAAHITVVEVNPHVIALRDQFEVPPDDDRFKVIRADGAEYVRSRLCEYDVVLVDGFDEGGQPPQLCSSGFYRNCHAALRPEGLMVANIHTDQGFADVSHSVCEVFGAGVDFIDATEGGNSIVFASQRKGRRARSVSPGLALQNLNDKAREQLNTEFLRILELFETTWGTTS